MLRFVFVLTALLFVASSADARVSWFGRAVITAAPGAACAADGNTVGGVFQTAFFPSGLTDNGPDTYLTFYSGGTAFSLKMVGRPAAGKAYTAIRINSYGKFNTGLAGNVTAVSGAANIGATTQFVNLTIAISNWDGTIGCTATLAIGSSLRH